MRKLFVLLLIALLSLEIASAKVFYFSDETDYRNNVGYAYRYPYSGVDLDIVGDFDNYACVSANDYDAYASSNPYDSHDELNAGTASQSDLNKLRRSDQLKIADENPYDSIDRDNFDSYDEWNCYTLQDYNSLARENPYDRNEVVDFTDFDHIEQAQKIGKYRYNNFFSFPEDLARFNLQYTRGRQPYYEPYDTRDSPYPLYGYGIARRED